MRPQHNNKSRLYLSLALILIVAQMGWWSSKLLIMAPGKPIRLDESVSVQGARNPGNGIFLATTVYAEPAGPLTGIYAVFSRDTDLYNHAGEEDLSDEVYRAGLSLDFLDSLRVAAAVALKELGYRIPEKKGLQIRGVTPGGPNDGKLMIGDILLWADGKRIRTSSDMLDFLSNTKKGNLVTLGLERAGKAVEYTCRYTDTQAEGYGGLGLRMLEHTDYQFPIRLDYGDLKISGSSAGLMFALEVYGQLSPRDIRKGRVIAGTGTLMGSGYVAGVGGVKQKVISARNWGADIFLAPRENLDEAKKFAGKMKVIPVETFQQCIRTLYKGN